MKGIIFDIKRFAVHDGPGVRTTLFFKGCPLKCLWCHNPESIEKNPVCVEKTVRLDGKAFTEEVQIGYEITVDELMQELLKEQVFMEESGGGVTFSGGEPMLQPEFLYAALKACKDYGLHTAVDTALVSSWQTIEKIASFTDLFLVDLKLIDDELHQKYTGVSNHLILSNIQELSESGKRIRIRIPMIPAVTNTTENIEQTIAFLNELKSPVEAVDLLPFHNTANEKYKRFHMDNHFVSLPSMDKRDVFDFKTKFEDAGFIVKIGG